MGFGNIRQPEFGQRLRRLREQRGLSQRDVAGGAVNPSYISLLESGARVPTLEVVVRLAQGLEVPVQELAGSAVLSSDETVNRGARLVFDILTRSSWDIGDLDDAETRFRDAYRSACQDGSPISAVEYGIALQEVLLLKAEHAERYRHLGEVAVLAEQVNVPEVIVKVTTDRASAARDVGRLGEALELAEEAVRGVADTSLSHTGEHVRTLGVLISILCETDHTTRVPRLIESMIDIANQIDRRPVLGRAHWVACVAFSRLGEPQQAERHFRYAREILATPGTPLREWARFSRAAASALLDAGADVAEVEQFLQGARAVLAVADVPGEAGQMRVLEARFALAVDDPAKALELSTDEPDDIPNSALIKLRVTRGRALRRLGNLEDAVVALRSAAALCEELELFRLAAQIWREIDEARSS